MLESVPHGVKTMITWPALILCASLFPAMPGYAQSAMVPTIETVYILPSAHWDLGFLRPPDQEMAAIKPHLDAVIDACEHEPSFRWTIESSWQLNAWLERTRDPKAVARMGDLLQKGQIELSAAAGSLHTEFLGSEELNRLVYASQQAGVHFGIRPQVAMMNDTPGFSSRVTQVLARSGIPFMLTGSNTALGGGTSLSPGKVPFYWEGPDGSKVLLWQTQGKNGGYTEGMADYYLAPSVEDPYLHTRFYPKDWSGLSDLEITRRGIQKLVSEYESAGYRHSIIAVLFMHDGIGPDDEARGLLPNVRAWNAAGMKPRLVVATPSEFFDAILKSDGASSFPTYRGDWNGLWARVKTNSPAMSAAALSLQDRLPEAETISSLVRMSGIHGCPQPDLSIAYRDLFIYDEHNGAGQGGWPKVMTRDEVLQQNEQYASKLQDAAARADRQLHTCLLTLASRPVAPSKQQVLIFNPSSWVTSRLTCIKQMDGRNRVRDEASGQVISSQALQSGELCFEARDVPSEGFRTYALERSVAPVSPIAKKGSALESPYYRVDLDSSGNILRILDKKHDRVVMDAARGDEAATLKMKPELLRVKTTAPVVLTRETGSVVDRMTIERPGSIWPQTVVTLPQSENRILISETLDRSQMPFVPFQGNGLDFSFGFKFKGIDSQLLVEDGNGVEAFPQFTLPGARKDAVVPRHAISWSNSACHVTLAQKDSFYDAIQWEGTRAGGVDVAAMLKSDQTETKDQGVQTIDTVEPQFSSKKRFAFAIASSSGAANPLDVYHDNVFDDANDVLFLPGTSEPPQPSGSLLSISDAGVVVLDLKPSEDGISNHYMLRLQEIAGKHSIAALTLPVPLTSLAETSLTEDRVLKSDLSPRHIEIGPHETLTLKLTVQPGAETSKAGAR
jgi:hypothetical protein